MPKKKIICAPGIGEKDIIAIYEKILPLLYSNPKNINIANELKKYLQKFIQYDFRHFVMEDPDKPFDKQGRSANFELLDRSVSANIFMSAFQVKHPKLSFDEMIEMGYHNALKDYENLYPKKPRQYHYHLMVSYTHPKIALGFFRYKNVVKNNSFNKNDLELFEVFKPHLFLLYRTVMSDALRKPSIQYFTVLNNICADIAKKYVLSDIEYKLLPEILYGLTNEEIAEKNFVSVAAIKKQINHIFKKTGTKKRVDFITKFFTSPDSADR